MESPKNKIRNLLKFGLVITYGYYTNNKHETLILIKVIP